MNKWHRQASRVYGKGQSYNLHNQITATTLQNTLNNYETKINELQKEITTNNNLNKIKQQVIALQMDIHNVQADLDKIKELLK